MLVTQKDYNKANVTSNFHQPIAKKAEDGSKNIVPAPNSYNVSIFINSYFN